MPTHTPPTHARDDRGVAVLYRDPMYRGSEMNRAEREAVNGRKSAAARPWLWAAIGVLLGIQALNLIRQPGSVVIPRLAFIAALVAAFVLICWWVVIPPIRRALWTHHWKSRYKAANRCPACQYSLAALPAASDGCTICPECGGAWRLTDAA